MNLHALFKTFKTKEILVMFIFNYKTPKYKYVAALMVKRHPWIKSYLNKIKTFTQESSRQAIVSYKYIQVSLLPLSIQY